MDVLGGCTRCVQRRPFAPMLILPRMLAESKTKLGAPRNAIGEGPDFWNKLRTSTYLPGGDPKSWDLYVQ